MLEPGARCANHPHNTAAIACARCGSYACWVCTVERPAGALCVACARRSPLGASWFAVIAAASGFVGIGCIPLAPVALALAGIDLVRLGMGRAPKEGLKLDAIAIALSLVACAVWAGIVWHHASAPPGTPLYDMPE